MLKFPDDYQLFEIAVSGVTDNITNDWLQQY